MIALLLVWLAYLPLVLLAGAASLFFFAFARGLESTCPRCPTCGRELPPERSPSWKP